MTNFEKICNGTAEDLIGVMTSFSGGRCSFCAYTTNVCEGNCGAGIIEWLNSPAPIELTQTEKEICVGLKHLGYRYLARDRNGSLCACKKKPNKGEWAWNECDVGMLLLKVSKRFAFIQWEDEEPTSIDNLLEVEG